MLHEYGYRYRIEYDTEYDDTAIFNTIRVVADSRRIKVRQVRTSGFKKKLDYFISVPTSEFNLWSTRRKLHAKESQP